MFKFCSHCGAEGTMKKSGTVFVEDGLYVNDEYTHEAECTKYRCTSCGGAVIENSSDFDINPESAYDHTPQLPPASQIRLNSEVQAAVKARNLSDYFKATEG